MSRCPHGEVPARSGHARGSCPTHLHHSARGLSVGAQRCQGPRASGSSPQPMRGSDCVSTASSWRETLKCVLLSLPGGPSRWSPGRFLGAAHYQATLPPISPPPRPPPESAPEYLSRVCFRGSQVDMLIKPRKGTSLFSSYFLPHTLRWGRGMDWPQGHFLLYHPVGPGSSPAHRRSHGPNLLHCELQEKFTARPFPQPPSFLCKVGRAPPSPGDALSLTRWGQRPPKPGHAGSPPAGGWLCRHPPPLPMDVLGTASPLFTPLIPICSATAQIQFRRRVPPASSPALSLRNQSNPPKQRPSNLNKPSDISLAGRDAEHDSPRAHRLETLWLC